jgi:hypothetical protein
MQAAKSGMRRLTRASPVKRRNGREEANQVLTGQFQKLIDGERQHAEHQMRHDLSAPRTRIVRAPNSSFKRL